MTLTPGTHLGPYEVLAKLGEGGMGEVYRARDTQLKREVALKVLPAAVATDPERLARFQREAELLASLNHPHIAQIYGVQESRSPGVPQGELIRALVMELVEGDDLSHRIAQGAMPITDALPLARQLADALDVAHERGIVHRDLKPANIKITPDGQVKVLDFGLAKAMLPDEAASSDVATMTSPAQTQAGIILGTAAYMAPEQARGRPVDKRADIWAFGVVLHEMLTGAKAFPGETITDVLAAIVQREPDWSALPKSVPARVRALMEHCLQKDPRARLRDIGDARATLNHHTEAVESRGMSAPNHPAWRPRLGRALWLAAGVAVGVGVGLPWRPVAVSQEPLRAALVLPPDGPLDRSGLNSVSIAPDGTRIVYQSVANGGRSRLVTRDLDKDDAVTLAGSEGGSRPFFSPDGRWVGFLADDGWLKKLPVSGGTAIKIAQLPDIRGASWGDDDRIILTSGASSGLVRVSAGGGAIEVLTTPDRSARERTHRLPDLLPGSRAVIYTVGSSDLSTYWDARVVIRDLATGRTSTLVEGGAAARYVAPGFLVYAKAGSLWAARFDFDRLSVGVPVEIQPNVSMQPSTGMAQYAVSRSGVLVYAHEDGQVRSRRQVVRVDRSGKASPIIAEPRSFSDVVPSNDEKRLLLRMEAANDPVTVYELATGQESRLTFSWNGMPYAWLPGDGHVLLASDQDGAAFRLYEMPAGGGDMTRLSEKAIVYADHRVRGDRFAVVIAGQETREDIFLLSVSTRNLTPFRTTQFSDSMPAVSPDGEWLAFATTGTTAGRFEIMMAPIADPSRVVPVSIGGGMSPQWSNSGSELFYIGDTHVMRVTMSSGANGPVPGRPEPLFDHRRFLRYTGYWMPYAVLRDGRFVMIEALPEATALPSINVVVNWATVLDRKLGR